MGGNLYFNRVGHVAVMGPSGKMISYGSGTNALDFKFSIKKSVYNQICDARIEIYGLNLPTIQRLTYWGYYSVDEMKKRRVMVYAGYADSGESLLYDGYGWRVTPTQPPNAGVIIEARNNLAYERKPLSVTVTSKVDFATIVEYVAEQLNLVPEIDKDVPKKSIANFHVNGMKADLIRSIEQCHDVYVWISTVPTKDSSGNERMGKLRVSNRIQTNPNNNGRKPITLDLEHGLLGLNSLSMSGIDARVRLDSRLDRSDWVKIDSSLYPKRATGYYWVNQIEHRGHLRGEEWETIIHAFNSNQLQ